MKFVWPWLEGQNIRIVDRDKLIVLPPDQDKGKLYFYLHSLCNSLPKVIVKVLCCLSVRVCGTPSKFLYLWEYSSFIFSCCSPHDFLVHVKAPYSTQFRHIDLY